MTYPEKYPKGFMAAVANKQETKEERSIAVKAGTQFFLDKIQKALNGFVVADAPMVLAALYIYCDTLQEVEPDSAELARMITKRAQVETTQIYMPFVDE